MDKPTDPTESTVKRLYAVAGNQCAFPGCMKPLVHGEAVVSKICHIEAANKGGPRYNPNQTDDERRAYANLVIMCGTHHDVIDSDLKSYKPERLHEIKAEHEEVHNGGAEPSDAVVAQFIATISDKTVVDGSIIYNVGQSGGQVAHSITNVGMPVRTIPPETRQGLIQVLRQFPAGSVRILAVFGEAEAFQFAKQILSLFKEAGWTTVGDLNQGGFDYIVPPLEIVVYQRNIALEAFGNSLVAAGFTTKGSLNREDQVPEIRIGAAV